MAEQDWTEAERWAWEQIKAGKGADFERRVDTILDPKEPAGWGEGQTLSPAFLKDILFRPPWRDQIPFEGVRIVGALFMERLDLVHGRLDHQLWLAGCRFERGADLSDLRVDGWLLLQGSAFLAGTRAAEGAAPTPLECGGGTVTGHLSMSGATVAGPLNMNGLSVGGSLFMCDGASFQEVNLGGARIEGQLSMSGATVAGPLNMAGLSVGQHLLMRDRASFQEVDLGNARIEGQLAMSGAKIAGTLTMGGVTVGQSLFMNGPGACFQEVILTGAKIGGQLAMSGAKVTGKLNMNGLSVGESLLMRDGASFQEVNLGNAKIGRQLSMIGATLAGELNMNSLSVGQHLFMDNASFTESIKLTFAHIGGGLNLRGARLSSLDLSATHIAGEFRPAAKWNEGARLTLVNTHAGTIEDGGARDAWPKEDARPKEDAWPKEMELDGFSYDRLGGFASQTGDMLDRPAPWFCNWLARDPTYAPQPYEQLAKVLRASGQPEKADAVLYASRERARKEAWKKREWGRWLGLSLLKWTIGYGLGHRYFRALLWVAALTALGAAVLWGFAGAFAHAPVKAAFYSLDRLLPLVELDPSFKGISLSGWVQYIFMGYELIGYVLASFLVAGLAGLTQK